jgi:flagellar assembly protein FliH
MVESEQIKPGAEALKIEAFRFSESPWTQDPAFGAESFPVSFPEAAVPAMWSASNSVSGLGEYQDDRACSPPQEWKFREVSELSSEAGIDNARSLCELRDDSAGSGDGDPGRVEVIESEQLFRQMLTIEKLNAEERGQAKGIEIGRTVGREDASREFGDQRERLVAQVAKLFESFSEARDNCIHHLEQEAVKLALAIAARVLRREAQTDPLLLIGAVRVALGQLASSTSVRLRVPARDMAMWKESLSLVSGLAIRPQVIGEPGMELGECRMETDLGSADLGLWSQLKSIERGFFDRVCDPVESRENCEEIPEQVASTGRARRTSHQDGERDGD